MLHLSYKDNERKRFHVYFSIAMDVQVLVLLLFLPYLGADPCDDGQSIVLRDNRRSENNEVGPDEDRLCDVGVINSGTWYKFEEELLGEPQQMAEGCVELLHCGTYIPLWLDGIHPTENDTDVPARVCSTHTTCADGCFDHLDIKIRKCGQDESFRYQLKPPVGCAVAYCAGDTPSCPDAEIWDPDANSCIQKAPKLIGDPVLSKPIRSQDQRDFWFTCDIPLENATNANRKAVMETVFLFNGKPDIATKRITTGAETVVYLYSRSLQGHLGTTVQCQVNVSWANTSYFPPPVVSDNSYFIGIQFYEYVTGTLGEVIPPVKINESDQEPRKLFPVSTVPILINDNENFIRLGTVFVADGQTASNCEVRIGHEDWDDTLNIAINRSHPYLITARRDAAYHSQQDDIFYIDFSLVGLIGTFWFDYEVPDVQVHYGDVQRAECYIWGDPHFTTFDGGQFNSYQLGDFYYVISDTVRNFQVQGRQYICNSKTKVTCTCAVAVQEGNTILGVDACELLIDPNSNSKPYLMQYSEEIEYGAAIYANGDSFAICMGSGTCVRMQVTGKSMSIWIDGIAEDRKNVRGMCGNFDGNIKNDLMTPDGDPASCNNDDGCMDYSNLWLVPDEFNLFETPQAQVNATYDVAELCNCVEDFEHDFNITCGPVVKSINLGTLSGAHKVAPELAKHVNQKRRIKSIADFSSVRQLREARTLTWPTDSGITEAQATQSCNDAITSSSAYDRSMCFNLFGQTLFDGVDGCVTDIQALDEIELPVKGIIAGMEEVCVSKVNTMEVKENVTGTEEDPAEILKELNQFVCPSQCNNNGICVNGTCSCDPGYIGSDCSVSEGDPPVVKSIEYTGTCDVREKSCTEVLLTVRNIVDTGLVCMVQHKPFWNLDDVETLNYTGRMRSKWEMSCPLPETPVSLNSSHSNPGTSVHKLTVSVSNNGVLFSSPTDIIVHDSICYSCDTPGNCTRQTDNCIIDGHCLAPDEVNPLKECEQCRPEINADDWSINEANNPPVYVGETSFYKFQDTSLTVQLQATDADNKTLQFSTDSTAAGLTVSISGLLVWASDANTNITVNLLITDDCGTSDFQQILLGAVECPCENGGTCVPVSDQQFVCDCPEGNTGEYCEVDITTTTVESTTTSSTVTTPSSTTVSPPPEWAPWSEWSECRGDCYYGLQTRDRECLDDEDTCTGSSTDVKVCIADNCTEIDDGTILVVNETITSFLSEKIGPMKSVLAEVINRECEASPGECCAMANMNPAEVDEQDFQMTSTDLVQVAKLSEVTEGLELTVLIEIDENLAVISCGTTLRTRRNTVKMYVDQTFVINSIRENEEYIEQSLDIQVLAVSDGEDDSGGGPGSSDDVALIVGLAVGGVVLVALVSLMVVWKLKFHPNKVTPRSSYSNELAGKEKDHELLETQQSLRQQT